MLEGLHPLERFKERFSIANRTVIRHEDRIMSWNEGNEAACDLVCASGCVLRQRDDSQCHNSFLAKHFVQCASSTSERGGDRRMGVNHRSYVFSAIVNCEMHANFAGHVP